MLVIINYHYIRESFNYDYPSIFGLTPNEFEEQLLVLSKFGKFIHPMDLLNESFIEKFRSKEELYFLITFDDGLKEQYTYAYPILKKLGVPAIFYVNAHNVLENKVSSVHQLHIVRSVISNENLFDILKQKLGTKDSTLSKEEEQRAVAHYIYDTDNVAFLKYLMNFKLNLEIKNKIIDDIFSQNFTENDPLVKGLYMNLSEIKELASENLVGDHTYAHNKLSLLSLEEVSLEIDKSKVLFDKIHYTPFSVSYPYGGKETINPSIFDIYQERGYQWGVSMERSTNVDFNKRMSLSRFSCNDVFGGKDNRFESKEDILNKKHYRKWFL